MEQGNIIKDAIKKMEKSKDYTVAVGWSSGEIKEFFWATIITEITHKHDGGEVPIKHRYVFQHYDKSFENSTYSEIFPHEREFLSMKQVPADAVKTSGTFHGETPIYFRAAAAAKMDAIEGKAEKDNPLWGVYVDYQNKVAAADKAAEEMENKHIEKLEWMDRQNGEGDLAGEYQRERLNTMRSESQYGIAPGA